MPLPVFFFFPSGKKGWTMLSLSPPPFAWPPSIFKRVLMKSAFPPPFSFLFSPQNLPTSFSGVRKGSSSLPPFSPGRGKFSLPPLFSSFSSPPAPFATFSRMQRTSHPSLLPFPPPPREKSVRSPPSDTKEGLRPLSSPLCQKGGTVPPSFPFFLPLSYLGRTVAPPLKTSRKGMGPALPPPSSFLLSSWRKGEVIPNPLFLLPGSSRNKELDLPKFSQRRASLRLFLPPRERGASPSPPAFLVREIWVAPFLLKVASFPFFSGGIDFGWVIFPFFPFYRLGRKAPFFSPFEIGLASPLFSSPFPFLRPCCLFGSYPPLPAEKDNYCAVFSFSPPPLGIRVSPLFPLFLERTVSVRIFFPSAGEGGDPFFSLSFPSTPLSAKAPSLRTLTEGVAAFFLPSPC